MPSPVRPVVFLDDGGVLNDNARRAPQWRRLLGEFMSPLLGGTPEQWAEANRLTFPPLWADLSARLDTFASHADYQLAYDLAWMRGMCEFVGVPLPPTERVHEIATAAATYITARVRSDYPDAVPAIHALHEAGFALHMASGTRSFELEGILTAMGVRRCFGHLFGPDLLNTLKAGPEYYRRMFAQANVNPAVAVIIEDSEAGCAWAEDVGATAIRVVRDRTAESAGDAPDLETIATWLLEGRV